jgi:hypothetical protein
MDREFTITLGQTLGVAAVIAAIVAWVAGWPLLTVWLAVSLAALVYVVPKEMDRVRQEALREASPKRAVQLADGLTVVFTKIGDRVTWEFHGLIGEPHFLAHDTAREILTAGQIADGEEPWFPDMAERLRKLAAKTRAEEEKPSHGE